MWKRKIQISVVKDDPKSREEALHQVLNPDEKAAAMGAMFGFGMVQVAKFTVLVIAADTVRKIAINRLSK